MPVGKVSIASIRCRRGRGGVEVISRREASECKNKKVSRKSDRINSNRGVMSVSQRLRYLLSGRSRSLPAQCAEVNKSRL